jgi:hypothetical protein
MYVCVTSFSFPSLATCMLGSCAVSMSCLQRHSVSVAVAAVCCNEVVNERNVQLVIRGDEGVAPTDRHRGVARVAGIVPGSGNKSRISFTS